MLSQGVDLDGSRITSDDQVYTWNRIKADESQHLKVTSIPGRPQGHTTFVAVPVERRSARDPYSELRYGPYRPFKGYVNGKLYKEVSIPNHPASAFNPPLPETRNLIVLEMSSDTPDFHWLRLYTREGTVRLPGGGENHGFRLP